MGVNSTLKHTFLSFLLLIFMGSLSYAQNDFEGPVMSSYTVSPSNIDISSGPVTVTISIRATDTSGVVAPSLKPYIYSPNIAGSHFYFSNWTLVQGDAFDGTYDATAFIDPTKVPSGSYGITERSSSFKDVNDFTADDISNLSITVVNYYGTQAPVNGNGTEESPYQIKTFGDLWWISQDDSR